MNETPLWMLSINAFLAVIVLLSLLGGVLKAITTIFPAAAAPVPPARTEDDRAPATRSGGATDPFVLTAIQIAVQRAHPGAQVRDVRERTEGAS